MKKKSLFLKHYLATALTVLLSLLLFALLFSAISYDYILSDKRDTISATASVVSVTTGAKSVDTDLGDWDLRMTISTIAEASGTHISLVDEDGVVRSCSDNDVFCEHIGSRVSLADAGRLAAEGERCVLTDLEGYYPVKHYLSCCEIRNPYTDELVGYVLVAADVESIVALWVGFFWIFVLAAAAVLILALLISWITVRRQVAPLRSMAGAARAFGRGDMTVRVSGYDRRDEIGELGEAFNQMAESLESTEERRRELIANLSHELKTPMTTIAGYAEGMLDGTIPWEQRERYLTVISDETRRLSRLVRKMLDLSRFQTTSEEAIRNGRCELCETVRMALVSLESRITAKGLDVDAQIPDEEIVVRGEGDSITQIAYNLLDNAVKFAYEGSTLTLRIWKNGGKVYVAVKNSGDTIPPEELPYLFDRFHKSDKSRSVDKEGVGLGLYIVKSLLNTYGEKIDVTSENGETEFTFTMTAAPQEP